jgi:hypothetical protein
MRTTLLAASLVVALMTPTSFADPVDEILSFARRSGYLSDYEVGEDDEYQPSSEFYDDGTYRRLYFGSRRRAWSVQRMSAAPAAEELLQMDYLTLRRVARASSADFDRWLSGIPAGEVWRKHFESRTTQEHLAPDVDAPPTTEERQAILRIVGIFDRAVATADLNDITRTASARTLHAVLRELATPPDQRLVRQLSLNARTLNRSLSNLNTGVTWQRYLALPDGVIAAADRPPGGAELRADRKELSKILERYDSISANPEYRVIASLPEFEATHQRLSEVVNPPREVLEQQPAEVAEELPPPELQTR